jgi:hypothetical protein
MDRFGHGQETVKSRHNELREKPFGWRTLIATLVVVVALSWFSTTNARAQEKQVVFSKDVTYYDLPSGIDKQPLEGASKFQIREMLSQQPMIVIDGATLSITPPRVGSGQVISVKSIEFRHGGRIVTNGVNLEINAELIVSDRGQILAFAVPVADQAGIGAGGGSGLGAGTVVLNGALKTGDKLIVSLAGQDGQSGGAGVPGPTGAQGPSGDNGADHLFDCAHGGGNGGAGSQGGKGGTGGSGGAGGDGGRLILRGDLAAQRLQIDFSAPGGRGGAGGLPGNGGAGGPGGPGGGGTTYCRGGVVGPSGPSGPAGEPGSSGHNGREGSISAD